MFFLLELFSSFLFLSVIFASSQQLPEELLFEGFKSATDNITLTGSSQIFSNGILRLTNDTTRLIGHAYYNYPFRFKNSTNGTAFSFSTSFAFVIVPEYPKLGGHGFAFTVSATKDFKALPSQYLGLLNATDVGNLTNHLFAVEFDTDQDFEFGDINDNHVGVDINSLNSSAASAANLNLKSGKVIKVWIEYDSFRNVIDVSISPTSKRPEVPILTFRRDLSLIFKEYMYVGFSASTGLLASSHYVLGWSFKINGQAPDLDLDLLPSLPGNSEKKHIGLIIEVSVASVIVFIAVLSLGIFYFVWRLRNAEVIEDWELEVGPHRFAYKELKQATRGFNESELLGRGGFGRVYKGKLPGSNVEVAVKRVSSESKQGLREFLSEISSIGRLRHRNLVQLLGWCRRKNDLLIVYDYMACGSLDNYLFDDPEVVLTWEQRFKIIKDVASGLLYLHEGYEQVVIHRDVKASNVLLDSELNGRLGDFGLARLYEHGANPSTTRVVGTLGYLAPELPRTGKATGRSDVYAFGAHLLEVVCGRRPVEPKSTHDELVLIDLVWEKYREGKVLDVVDQKLNGNYNESEVMMVIKLGIMCSHREPMVRPSMRQVVRYLDGEVLLPQNLRPPNGVYCDDESRGYSEGFDDFVNSFPSSSFGCTSLASPSISLLSNN